MMMNQREKEEINEGEEMNEMKPDPSSAFHSLSFESPPPVAMKRPYERS